MTKDGALPGKMWHGYQPQGFLPDTVPDTYPHLGFNPAPGSPDTVHALRAKLIKCAGVLDETREMITKLMDGAYWKGDAAVAFRQQLEDGPLPLNLKNAARSIRKAAHQLDRWESDLDVLKDRAKHLDNRARDAREALGDAENRAAGAKEDAGSAGGDSKRDGKDGADADAAMRRLNAAVDAAHEELKGILSDARVLAWEHENKANERADRIRDATDKLAPQEPNFFEKAAAWVTENLPDILSVAAGVVALAALTIATGGTATVALMLVGAALSASALLTRLSDPAVRASIWDGITKGEFDADFWNNSVSVLADGLSVLPGAAAVGKGIRAGVEVIRTSTDALTLGQKFSAVGSRIVTESQAVAALGNPLLARGVHAVGGTAQMAERIELGAGTVGVLSSGIGLLGTGVEALENEVVGGSDSLLGSIEIAGLTSGEVFALTRHLSIL